MCTVPSSLYSSGPVESNGTYGIDEISRAPASRRDREIMTKDSAVVETVEQMLEAGRDRLVQSGIPFFINMWSRMTHRPVTPPLHLVERFAGLQMNSSLFGVEIAEKLDLCASVMDDPLDGMRKYVVHVHYERDFFHSSIMATRPNQKIFKKIWSPCRSHCVRWSECSFGACALVAGMPPPSSSHHLTSYLAEMYGFDLGVGAVLAKLDDLEITESTIVIFTSDHGAAPVTVDRDRLDHCNLMGSPSPFTGGKHELSEGGVRVPMIIRWPGHVPAGTVNHHTTFTFVDWMPTITALARLPASETPTDLDGKDMSAVLLGTEQLQFRGSTDEDYICWHLSDSGGTTWVIVHDEFKLIEHVNSNTLTLFNVDDDPEERRNRSDEPQLQARMIRMIRLNDHCKNSHRYPGWD